MIVDLREIRQRDKPHSVKTHFDAEQLGGTKGLVTLPGGADCDLVVTAMEAHASVTGHVASELLLTCCRCLKRFPLELDKNFRVDYAPDLDASLDGEELTLTYSELDVGFYHNNELDLTAVVSEQLHLEVPMKPVCDDQCRGLCDQCGIDLNQGSCDCTHEAPDPRLDALRDLRKRMPQ